MTLLQRYISENLTISGNYAERWEGPDQGLICAWLTGLKKGTEDTTMAYKALNGELPLTPFKGGVEKSLKSKTKIGAHHYVAYWQGLRSEDLAIDPDTDIQLTCSRTGVTVTFTSNIAALLAAEPAEA